MDSVNERRLRPVYDFIDAANYKKALQEVEKVLKKQRDFQCAKVLKGLALLRIGRESESRDLLHEVHDQCPTDDATLQAMTICYREMGRPDQVTEIYERALARDPGNEELASHLFMSHVRTGDVKKQQLVALSLYKLKPKNPYYFWHVMSLYLQAVAETDVTKRALLLTLAEKKVDKMVTDKKIEAEAEVELLLMILDKEEKFEQMIQVMEGPLGARFLPNHIDFMNRRKAFLYLRMGSMRRAFDAFKCLLDSNPDQMEYYRNYISAAFALDQEEEGHKKHTGMVIDFVRKLTEKSVKKNRLRGPFLAKIELYFLLTQKEETDPGFRDMKVLLYKKPVDGFVELFNYFGHKNPFYSDVCYIFSKYKSHCQDVVQQLPLLFSSQATYSSTPADLDHMKWCSAVHYLEDLSGSRRPDPQTISRLLSLYFSCMRLGDGLLPSEINPSDDFALLAAHLLSDKEATEVNLMMAILILRKAIDRSPANHTMKLLLMMLFNNLGCVSMSYKLFESLETKYIQVDTLHYLMHSSLLACGDYASALMLFSYASRFYLSSCKDTNDYTNSCYKYGSFTKIEELTKLKQDLRNSLQYHGSTIDTTLLQIVTKDQESVPDLVMSIKAEKLDCLPNQPVDNRDIRVFCNTPYPIQDKLQAWKTWSYECDVQWFKFRSLILKAVRLTHTLIRDKSQAQKAGPAGVTNGTSDPSHSLKVIVDQMRDLCQLVPEPDAKLKYETIPGPHAPRLLSFAANDSNKKQVIALMDLVLAFITRSKESPFTFDPAIADLMHESVDWILSLDLKSVRDVKWMTEAVAHQTEILSLSCVLLSPVSSCCKKVATPASSGKGKRRDRESVGESAETIASFKSLVQRLESTSTRLLDRLKVMDLPAIPDPLPAFTSDADLWKEQGQEWSTLEKQVAEEMRTSQRRCLASLCVAIEHKCTFLLTL